MPNAFSLDLRERVWRAYKQGNLSQPPVAEQFGVSASFVRDLVRRKRETGSLAPKPHGGGHPPALDNKGLEHLAQSVARKSDATLEELAEDMHHRHKLRLSASAVRRALGWLKLTRKKEGSPRQRKRQLSRVPLAT
jgi:transposase